MWLGILSGLYAVPALLGLLLSVWQAVSAVRQKRMAALGWLCVTALLLTGRRWVRLLRPVSADEPKALPPGRRGTAAGAGGVRLEWEEFGPNDAPALLLTHGWSLSHETWYYQKEALSDEFRVIVWDLRGTDRSQAPADRDYSFEAMAADLAAVFAATDAGRHPQGCVLAGHSVGAMLLPLFALSYPQHMARVRGLAFLGGTDSPMLETMRGRRVLVPMRRWFWEPLARLMGFAPAPFEAFVRLIYRMGCVHAALMYGTNCGQDSRGQNDLVARHCAEFSMRVAGLGALACFAFDCRALLPNINVPTLVITGTGDGNTPPDIQRAMARRLPQAELVLIENCGHLSLLECHSEVNAHLRDFARRCLTQAPAGAGGAPNQSLRPPHRQR